MKRISQLLLLLLLINACKEKQQTTLSGTIKKFGSGEIYLIEASDEATIDTIKVENDKFNTTLNIKSPTFYMLNFGPNQKPAFLILENGVTTIDYEMNNFNSLKVKGGKEQDFYDKFLNENLAYFERMDSIGTVANEFAENEEMLNVLKLEFLKADSIVKANQINFVKNNPNAVVSAFLAYNYLNQESEKNYENAESLYKSLGQNVQQTYYGKKIDEIKKQLQNTSIGSKAPDFTLNDVNGKTVKLSDFKGKITLIDFWASWCGPCRRENPNVVATYKKYHDKGFEILGVSLDDSKEKWVDAIAKDGITWVQVSDFKGWESDVARLYGIEYIPSNILLDEEGKIIGKDLMGPNLDETLKNIFK